jgi:hypothetical protein
MPPIDTSMQYRKTYFSDGNFHFILFGDPSKWDQLGKNLKKSLIPLGKESFAFFFL